jgi:hypothetical protein
MHTTKSKCQCGNFSYIPLRRANTKTSRPFHLSLALRSLELSPKLGAKYAVSSRDNKYVRSLSECPCHTLVPFTSAPSTTLPAFSVPMHCGLFGWQVCAVTRGGAFAEEVVVPEGAVLKLPQGVDLVTAAGRFPSTLSGPKSCSYQLF